MRPFRIAPLVLVACLTAAPVSAAPLLIDFETLPDLTPLFQDDLVTGQFDGVTFSGAQVYTSGAVGGLLNEGEFPPHSGFNVILDAASEIEVTFATGATSVGAYVTYVEPFTMTAYNGNAVLDVLTSLSFSNLGTNELFLISSDSPITRVTFAGNPMGSSFTLDDFSADLLEDTGPTPVPEPATATLVALGAVLLIRQRKTRAGRG